MLIEKSYLDLAMPATIENWSIGSEMTSLSVKISRLLCTGGEPVGHILSTPVSIHSGQDQLQGIGLEIFHLSPLLAILTTTPGLDSSLPLSSR